MSATRRPRCSPFAVIRVATFVVAVALPAAASGQTSSMQALMIGTSWSGWMNQGQVLQTALPTGGTAAQVTVLTNYLASPLLDFITASVAGKSVSTPLQFATYTSTAQPVSLLKIAGARIQEVDLPAADDTKSIQSFPVSFGILF